MKSDKKILFISNGHGEDEIATSVVLKLAIKTGKENILAFPLVGEGKAYRDIGIKIVAPTRNMPSGGLIPGGWIKNLWMDFTSGLGRLIFKQIDSLKKLKDDISVVVAVGDTYPVILSGMFTGKTIVYVGTAKSNYFYPYSGMEKMIYKKYCDKVFPRDEITAEALRKSGVKAQWVGNAMMDSLNITGERFGISEDRKVITILPGSRSSAYQDLPVILNAMDKVVQKSKIQLDFVIPLADSIAIDKLADSARESGFSLNDYHEEDGLVGKLIRQDMRILLLRKRFGDAINIAFLVVGQAGTGNEQAVGMGKPVITFDSDGNEKLGWYRLRQKGLLSDSILIVSRNSKDITKHILKLLDDKETYKIMADIGVERMGPAGGAEKMADYIFSLVDEKKGSVLIPSVNNGKES